MNRILIAAAFAALLFSPSVARAQSWIFQPGPYTQKKHGPAAPESKKKPRVYATFTESQAAEAAKIPEPPFQWDPTGVLGRGRRYDMWRHQEIMEANRLRTYAEGVRDAVGAPVWTWPASPLHPMPRILAPTEESPGKTKPLPRP